MMARLFPRNDALPTEVPKEMQDKFEVREMEVKDEMQPVGAASPGPGAPASPSAQAGVPNPGGNGSGAVSRTGGDGAPSAQAALISTEVSPPVATRHGSKKRKGARLLDPARSFVGPPAPRPVPVPNRRPPVEPIWISERLTYQVSYLGVPAGEFVLEALPFKSVGSRRVYHLRGTAHTSKVFSIFYKLDDMVETFVDFEGFFSHRFHIALDETKQVRDSIELYDSDKKETFYWDRWDRPNQPHYENKVFSKIDPYSQDTLSSIYYLRSVPLPTGAVVTFPVVSEGNTVYAHVTVLRRETIDGPEGKVRCVVLKPEVKTHGVMTKKGDSFIWLTDDDRRFLVRLEAKVKIGTVVANLTRMEPGTPPAAQVSLQSISTSKPVSGPTSTHP